MTAGGSDAVGAMLSSPGAAALTAIFRAVFLAVVALRARGLAGVSWPSTMASAT